MDIAAMITKLFVKNGMIFGFMLLGVIMYVSFKLGALTKGRVHGSAIAIFLGLVLAYIGGEMTGGSKGIADVPLFAGMGLVGGAMFRDFAIVSTAFGADLREIKRWAGEVSLPSSSVNSSASSQASLLRIRSAILAWSIWSPSGQALRPSLSGLSPARLSARPLKSSPSPSLPVL